MGTQCARARTAFLPTSRGYCQGYSSYVKFLWAPTQGTGLGIASIDFAAESDRFETSYAERQDARCDAVQRGMATSIFCHAHTRKPPITYWTFIVQYLSTFACSAMYFCFRSKDTGKNRVSFTGGGHSYAYEVEVFLLLIRALSGSHTIPMHHSKNMRADASSALVCL